MALEFDHRRYGGNGDCTMRLRHYIVSAVIVACLGLLFARRAHPQATVGMGTIGDPCLDARILKKVVAVGTTTATTTAMTAVSGTASTYVCDWFFVTGATAQTLTFEQGTGAACAANVTALTGAMVTPVAITFLSHQGSGSLFVASPVAAGGTGLCLVTGSTSVVNGYVTYVQQ